VTITMSKKDINFIKFIKPQVKEKQQRDKWDSYLYRAERQTRQLSGGLP